MSANKELIQKLVHTFNTADPDALNLLVSDTVKHTAQGTAFGVDLEGREPYVAYMSNLFNQFKSMEFRPVYIFEDISTGSTIAEWEGEFTTVGDSYYATKGVLAIDIVDGKIDWVRDYFDTEKTRAAHKG